MTNSFSNISHNIKHRTRTSTRDKFYTPEKLTKEMLKFVPFKDNDFVLDPAYGKGIFYKNFPDFVRKDFCEIDFNSDFFDYYNRVDWCVTNPPYSMIENWLKHSCEISKKGFAYLLGQGSITPRRIELCNNQGFGITFMHLCKVFKWFGISAFVIFEKNKNNIFSYDRIVWR